MRGGSIWDGRVICKPGAGDLVAFSRMLGRLMQMFDCWILSASRYRLRVGCGEFLAGLVCSDVKKLLLRKAWLMS